MSLPNATDATCEAEEQHNCVQTTYRFVRANSTGCCFQSLCEVLACYTVIVNPNPINTI